MKHKESRSLLKNKCKCLLQKYLSTIGYNHNCKCQMTFSTWRISAVIAHYDSWSDKDVDKMLEVLI